MWADVSAATQCVPMFEAGAGLSQCQEASRAPALAHLVTTSQAGAAAWLAKVRVEANTNTQNVQIIENSLG